MSSVSVLSAMTQMELYHSGLAKCQLLLKLNHIEPPHFHLVNRGHRVLGDSSGVYWRGNVYVCLENCAYPATSPGNKRWSYPGYKTNRTPEGVVCHELGHHLWRELEGWDRTDWVRLVKRSAARVSSYEPTPEEAFAETIKLYATNPDLLRLGIPERYGFVSGAFRSPETRTFRQVLGDHPAYVQASLNWIAKNKSIKSYLSS